MTKIMRILILLVIVLTTCGPPGDAAAAADTVYAVVIANDPRLPAVSEDKIENALTMAAEWIETWYRKKIRFEIRRTEDIDPYVSSHLEKPPIPPEWNGSAYALDGSDHVGRFVAGQEINIRKYPVEELKSYAPESIKHLFGQKKNLAGRLLKYYADKVTRWRTLKSADGVPYLDAERPQKHSIWHWLRVFRGIWPENVKDNLIITNVMLVDDAPAIMPPHSLIRGGLLNGFAVEEAPQSVVSTFLMFTDHPEIATLRDTELSESDRVRALAHVIAHEFGAHILQGYFDVYSHDACLARPTAGLEYAQTFKLLFAGPPCKKTHPPLDRDEALALRYEELFARYVTKEEYGLAKTALLRLKKMDPNRPDLNYNLGELEKALKYSKKGENSQ